MDRSTSDNSARTPGLTWMRIKYPIVNYNTTVGPATPMMPFTTRGRAPASPMLFDYTKNYTHASQEEIVDFDTNEDYDSE